MNSDMRNLYQSTNKLMDKSNTIVIPYEEPILLYDNTAKYFH